MEWVIYATVTLAGLFVGSFLNVVIHRGPAMWGLIESDKHARGTLFRPSSRCPGCARRLRFYELAPVLSYAALRGRCRGCSMRISPRYPLVEACGAAAAAFSVAAFGMSFGALFAFLFLCALIALAMIDHETGYLPDAITLPLIVTGLAVNAGGAIFEVAPFGLEALDALMGATAGFAAFWTISILYLRLRGRDGLGLGDAKLLSAIGAWAGWQALAPTILLASVLALASLTLIARGQSLSADTPVRFGPALCVAAAAIFLLPSFAPSLLP